MMPAKEGWARLQDIITAIDNFIAAEMTPKPVAVIHFGSSVSPPIQYESDIDMLFLFESLPTSRLEASSLFIPLEKSIETPLAQLAKSGFNYHLSPMARHVESADHFSAIYLDMVEKSRISYDPKGVAARLIERTRRFISRHGSRKTMVHGRPVWIYGDAPGGGKGFDGEF